MTDNQNKIKKLKAEIAMHECKIDDKKLAVEHLEESEAEDAESTVRLVKIPWKDLNHDNIGFAFNFYKLDGITVSGFRREFPQNKNLMIHEQSGNLIPKTWLVIDKYSELCGYCGCTIKVDEFTDGRFGKYFCGEECQKQYSARATNANM